MRLVTKLSELFKVGYFAGSYLGLYDLNMHFKSRRASSPARTIYALDVLSFRDLKFLAQERERIESGIETARELEYVRDESE